MIRINIVIKKLKRKLLLTELVEDKSIFPPKVHVYQILILPFKYHQVPTLSCPFKYK